MIKDGKVTITIGELDDLRNVEKVLVEKNKKDMAQWREAFDTASKEKLNRIDTLQSTLENKIGDYLIATIGEVYGTQPINWCVQPFKYTWKTETEAFVMLRRKYRNSPSTKFRTFLNNKSVLQLLLLKHKAKQKNSTSWATYFDTQEESKI